MAESAPGSFMKNGSSTAAGGLWSGRPLVGGPLVGGPLVGLYEKALPAEWSWEQRLAAAAEVGYRYMEISIDETDERLSRLANRAEQRKIREAIDHTGVPLLTMCLSGHRKYPFGSASSTIRARSYEVMQDALDFAVGLGVRIIQLAGYDVYYEPHTDETLARFIEGLLRATEWAGQAGVMLGIENVDVPVTASLHDSLRLVERAGSPWLQIYGDMANVAAAGFDPCVELELCGNHLVAVHVKDGQPGVVRGVPFASGIVPFDDVFRTLRRMGFCGPLTVEMWANLTPASNPLVEAHQARLFVQRLLDMTYPTGETE